MKACCKRAAFTRSSTTASLHINLVSTPPLIGKWKSPFPACGSCRLRERGFLFSVWSNRVDLDLAQYLADASVDEQAGLFIHRGGTAVDYGEAISLKVTD